MAQRKAEETNRDYAVRSANGVSEGGAGPGIGRGREGYRYRGGGPDAFKYRRVQILDSNQGKSIPASSENLRNGGIAALQPDARGRAGPRLRPGRRSIAPPSGCGDKRAPRARAAPAPPRTSAAPARPARSRAPVRAC